MDYMYEYIRRYDDLSYDRFKHFLKNDKFYREVLNNRYKRDNIIAQFIKNHQFDKLRLLIECDVNNDLSKLVNSICSEERNVLMIALTNLAPVDIIKFIVDKSESKIFRDFDIYGKNVIHYISVCIKDLNLIKDILDKTPKSIYNKKDLYGNRMLDYARLYNNTLLIGELVYRKRSKL